MGFPRREYCSGFPFPSPGHLHDQGIDVSCIGRHWQVDSYHRTTKEALLNTLPCLKYVLVGNCYMTQGAQPGTL